MLRQFDVETSLKNPQHRPGLACVNDTPVMMGLNAHSDSLSRESKPSDLPTMIGIRRQIFTDEELNKMEQLSDQLK